MKRAVLLCSLALLFALLFSFAMAEGTKPEAFTNGDYKYILLDDSTVEIQRYSGKDETLFIPDTIDEKRVTSIGKSAFRLCSSLIKVTIPDSVINIEDSAFLLCKSLETVIIPDSVMTIGINPFIGCEVLKDIRVSPDNLTLAVIDGVLFYKGEKRLVCYPCGLIAKSYEIPQGILEIGVNSFRNCTTLENVIIPESVINIGESAFSGCSNLLNVMIPKSVISIGNGSFSVCKNLNNVIISEDVISIGDYAFSECDGLKSITLPNSIADLGTNPFSSCINLTDINVLPNHPTLEVIDGALFSKPDKRLVSYPCGLNTSSFKIPQGILLIGNHAFSLCSNLTNVTIPKSVVSIGADAFNKCQNIMLTVTRDSYAAQYCKENNLNYTYPDSLDWLNN